MKKFMIIFSAFLFISLHLNTIGVFAEPQSKTLTQGIHNARDENLLIGTPLTARITPSNEKAIIIVVDSDQTIEALIRLNPQIPQQILPPLSYTSSIIIYSNGSVVLS